MKLDTDRLLYDIETALAPLETRAQVLDIKSTFLGKQGPLHDVLKSLKNLPEKEKKVLGSKINTVKAQMNTMVADKLQRIERRDTERELAKNRIDITLKDSIMASNERHGGLHPTTRIQYEIEDIFLSMGFESLDGPHIEDEFHNFEALNIPSDHPARDMQDTFWFHDETEDKRFLLRTHTSTIQIRGMAKRKPPFAFIAPGKVFRCERTDASHEMAFHQLEGMMVDEGISVANLIYVMKTLLTEVFQKKINVRLRPGFFPFVEPGFELDIECQVCRQKGCSVCKNTGWLELLPCGMIHPHVLTTSGIDPKIYSGFAFGLGLDRLVMMKYGIDDIRHIHGGDLRFLHQFKDF